MFVAKYIINNSILKHIGIIDASREVITHAPLIPAWEAKFRKEAVERTVHHGTHLEGNRLTEEEVQNVLDGKEVIARDRDIQEIINYRNVVKFIDAVTDQIGPGKPYYLTLETILEIHRLTVDRLVAPESAGVFRQTQVVLRDSRTGEVSFTPPPAVEVPFLAEELINWVNSAETKELHPVLKAGIVHYELARIHPFVEGNGRTARALANLLMFLDGYDVRRLFSLEEYFDENPFDYYVSLQSVSNQPVLDNHERDLTPWIDYFVKIVAVEFNRIKERVRRISADARVKDKLGEQVQLNERQMMIMEFIHRHKTMQNKDFRKIFPDFSDDTVLREMKFLKQKGLVKKVGGTKKAAYVLR